MSRDETFRAAAAAYGAGRFDEAERLCRAVLDAGADFDALHMLGALRAKVGDAAEAVRLFERALAVKPDSALVHFHLGRLLSARGQNEAALAHLTNAVEIMPDAAPVRFERANLLWKMNRLEEAADAFAALPGLAEAHANRAALLLLLGRIDEAMASCDAAAGLRAAMPELTVLRARAFALRAARESDEDRPEEALATCDRALALVPDLIDAHYQRGLALRALHRPMDALVAFDAARAIDADFAPALFGRCGALIDLDRLDEALASSEAALALVPDAAAFNNKGAVLRRMHRHADAKAAFDRALALQPDFAEARFNRSGPLFDLGRLDEAATDLDRALALKPDYPEAVGYRLNLALEMCDWQTRARLKPALEAYVSQGKPLDPLCLHYLSDDPTLLLHAARNFAVPRRMGPARRKEAGARLRIAYLSSDFRNHPVAFQAVTLFERHDRTRFETFGVCVDPDRPGPSPIRERLARAFEHFLVVGERGDDDIAALLAEHGIDIAVDLGGYTDKARPEILARRTVPVTAIYLGYPGTLGTGYIDYLIADARTIPPEDDGFYTEKIVRLPCCFMPAEVATTTTCPRASAGLPENGFVFCAFNNPCKLSPDMFDIWMRLLKAVDGSVLWLNVHRPQAMENLRLAAEIRDVARERLVFAPRTAAREDNLARLACADLYLDSHPYGAHATAADFLLAGVPLLALRGRSFASRVAADMLEIVDRRDLIAADAAAYEATALALARDPARLSRLRHGLVEAARTKLFDAARLCRAIERGYLGMWRRACAGEPPASFDIAE